jgi:hypothetical protein
LVEGFKLAFLRAILLRNLAPEIVCGVIFWGSFFQQAFFWVRLNFCFIFWG